SRDPIGAGQLLTYTFTFTNAGGHADGITVTADVPAGTTFEDASSEPDSEPAVGGTGTVTWSLDELPMSGGGIVTMTVRVVSSLPAPDLGTDDRWTFPFLPAGSSRTINIVTEVKAEATPGTIVQNMAEVEDDTGRVARTFEDTEIVEPGVLGMSIDDLPDP